MAPGPSDGGHQGLTLSFFLLREEGFFILSLEEGVTGRPQQPWSEDRLWFLIIRKIKVYRQKCGFAS